jgi:hypothetical protein
MYNVKLTEKELEKIFPRSNFNYNKEAWKVTVLARLDMGFCNCNDCPFFIDESFETEFGFYSGICKKFHRAIGKYKMGLCK